MPVGQVHTATDVLEPASEVTGGSLVITIGMGSWVACGSTDGCGAQAVAISRIIALRESFISELLW
jgi:hypothetical protein